MNAIFFKEIRETGKWAFLLMVLLSVVLYLAISEFELTIVGNGILLVGTFGFSITAAAIGMIQVMHDWPMNRWSFLTHRPISRSRIFLAKTLAGLCMYAMAAGLPLLAAIGMAATPGIRRLPFTWEMTLPGIALWFHGLLWYFAGIVITTRDARWYATRLLPVGGAIILSAITIVLTLNFVEVYLVIALGLFILIPAAYGGYISAGRFDRQPLFARVSHVLTVTAAMLILCMGGGGLISESIRHAWYPRHSAAQTSYLTDSQGRIIAIQWNGGNGEHLIPILLSGPPLTATQPFHEATGHVLPHEGHHSYLNFHDPRERENHRGQMPQWMSETYLQQVGKSDGSIGYYLPGERRIYYVDRPSGRLIGTMGPQGFLSPSTGRAQPFASNLYRVQSSFLFVDDTNVYQTISQSPYLNTLADLGPDDRAFDAVLIPMAGDRDTSTLFVSTRKGIRAWRDGKELFTFTPPATLPEYWGVSIVPTTSDTFMLLFNQAWVYGPPPAIVIELSNTGQVLRKVELPLLQFPTTESPQWLGIIPATISPPLWTFTVIIRWLTTANQLGVPTPGAWIFPTTAILFAILAVASVFALRSRLQLSRNATLAWGLLALVTGMAGVLTLLAIRGLPRRIKCPSCNQARAINQPICPRCAAPFSPPRQTGIEIFAGQPDFAH